MLSDLRKKAGELELLPGLLILSLLVNVTLAYRITSTSHIHPGRFAKRDSVLRPATLTTLDNRAYTVDFRASSKPTIIYVFSPYCIWCLRNVANIRALTAQVSGRYNIIGISILGSGTEQFISEHGVRFPVYIDAGGAASATWGAFGTPTTIVVSPNGKILDLWSGAYRDSSLSEIQSALHVKLPGLQDVPEHARVTQPDLEATEYLPSNELSLRPTFMANIDQRKLVRVPAMADIWYEAQTDRVRYLRALQPSRLQPSHNGRCIRDSSNNVIPITKLFAGEKLCFVTERLHSVELTVKQIPGDRTSEPLILALPRETEHH